MTTSELKVNYLRPIAGKKVIARGYVVKIGKTLSINPGSSYEEGMLMGAIVQLDAKKGIKSYQLVNG